MNLFEMQNTYTHYITMQTEGFGGTVKINLVRMFFASLILQGWETTCVE